MPKKTQGARREERCAPFSLLVTASTFPLSSKDSCPRFVLDLCRGLEATGHVSCLVLAPHAAGAKREERVEGVRVRRYRYAFPETLEQISGKGILASLGAAPWRWSLVPGFCLAQWRELRRACRELRPSAVLAHWMVPQGVLAVLAATAPVIIVVHGGDLELLKRSPALQSLGSWLLDRASHVVAVSPYVAAELTRVFGTDPEKISVIPMGVDARRFFRAPARRADRLLFVGRLVPGKGLDVLLEAMARIDAKAKLDVLGEGPLRARLESRARDLGIEDRVRFLGGEPHASLCRRLRGATALVVPSIVPEGLGLVIPEAFAAGVPVIATRSGGIADAVAHLKNGLLVKPGDARALAGAISRLLANTALQQRLAEAGRETFERHFSLDKISEEFLRLVRYDLRP